jgi:hypothetical protein
MLVAGALEHHAFPARAFAALLWLFLLAMSAVLALDSAAYLYGKRRPYLAARWPLRVMFSAPKQSSGLGFAVAVLCSYALVLYCFASLYLLISKLDPNSFSHSLTIVDALYYTVGNAVTAGAGEIVARSQFARALTTIEHVICLLFNISILSGIITFAARRSDA